MCFLCLVHYSLLSRFLCLSPCPLVLSLPIFSMSCHIHTMGPCFPFNGAFLILTSILGVISGYPGHIFFPEFFFISLRSHYYLSCMAPVWHSIHSIMISINQKPSTTKSISFYGYQATAYSPRFQLEVGPDRCCFIVLRHQVLQHSRSTTVPNQDYSGRAVNRSRTQSSGRKRNSLT